MTDAYELADAARPEPPLAGGELATLTGFLDFQRATFAWKCTGLSTEQLRARPLLPSTLSLLGLTRHLAEVELGWFRNILNSEGHPGIWRDSNGRFAEFAADEADPDEAFAHWRAECEHARELVAAAPSLDVLGRYRAPDGKETEYSLRWILTHMIEEYARHNGHADLIREHLDGRTGE
ncbi:DinB family protein [Kitasatospora purpeofusca]|uniref:DinB family protein n=1 Tax=Kitasatospora purpeofusca TaxID=67352 RepID=UPI00224D924E|nr:DinB family protein [Kitasatospora purpeofusca]MCX4689173.1 DinB family protein [Kitasatospora purpeofusca]